MARVFEYCDLCLGLVAYDRNKYSRPYSSGVVTRFSGIFDSPTENQVTPASAEHSQQKVFSNWGESFFDRSTMLIFLPLYINSNIPIEGIGITTEQEPSRGVAPEGGPRV